MIKEAVSTPRVATPTNPYSLAVKANGLLFVSGQVGKDSSGQVVEGFGPQVRQAMENLKAIVEAAGCSMDHMLKLTVYLTDISRIAEMNAIYREYFNEPLPARATVEVSRLGLTAEVEIDAIAVCD